MSASIEIGGFTRGQSDILRKAIGSKNEELAREWIGYVVEGSKEHNIPGGISRGYSKEMLDKLQKQWMEFASYSFNKSH